MRKIVECVPNFSEGRDKSVIDRIIESITTLESVNVLNIDMGRDTNRTVVTFTVSAEDLVEAGLRGIKRASELIDMSRHTGEHARMGATDVFPIIPVSGVSVKECVLLAEELARRVGTELSLPVFLYGKAAKNPFRIKLSDIRKGEYEALEKKLLLPEFKPDYGLPLFNPKAGAVVVGVRDFLLAYNVNLNTRDKKIASDIALSIREKGRAKRDSKGNILRDKSGASIKVPGRLAHCEAAGWYIEEYGYAQVTMNLTDYNLTGLNHAFEAVLEEAVRRGLRVTGSEVIGLLPKEALLKPGRYYLKKMGKNTGIPEKEVIHTAILSLGLNDSAPFNPEEKIIEYATEQTGKLQDLEIKDFIDELSSSSMAPGGGSVSALSGALGAALASMVASLTFEKKSYRTVSRKMEETAIKAQRLKDRLIELINEDTISFNEYIASLRKPKTTETEILSRKNAIAKAVEKMTEVPLETLRLSREIGLLAEFVIKSGIPSALSDGAVALCQANASAVGAYCNVKINLREEKNPSRASKISEDAETLYNDITKRYKRVITYVKKRL